MVIGGTPATLAEPVNACQVRDGQRVRLDCQCSQEACAITDDSSTYRAGDEGAESRRPINVTPGFPARKSSGHPEKFRTSDC